jgi:hypothetical protein
MEVVATVEVSGERRLWCGGEEDGADTDTVLLQWEHRPLWQSLLRLGRLPGVGVGEAQEKGEENEAGGGAQTCRPRFLGNRYTCSGPYHTIVISILDWLLAPE